MSYRRYKFNDNKRIVDYVLKYDKIENSIKLQHRQTFLKNLDHTGLEYEEETYHKYFKIHVPRILIYKYCDALKIKLPVKDGIVKIKYTEKSYILQKLLLFSRYSMHPLPVSNFLQGRLDLFNVEDENFFKPPVRSMIARAILNKVRFSDDRTAMGLERVIHEQIFTAAYPLHDGSINDSIKDSRRVYLLRNWANFKKMFHPQPFEEIKDYCGIKVTLYFIWLAYYTLMLIPPSIIGTIFFIYGLINIETDTLSRDICNSDYIMCPKCDECDYWKLSDTCFYSKLTHAIDNKYTILFSIFMSIWSAMYLKLWKRYSAEIIHFWGLHDYRIEDELPRINYQRSVKKYGKISFWRHKCPCVTISFGLVCVWIFLPVVTLISITAYKWSVQYATLASQYHKLYQNIIIPITAAILQLILICLSSIFYRSVSKKLTELEYQRTETEFNDSLNIKIYLFEFFNYYSSIFYIAFLKGRFVGRPGQYIRIFGNRQPECIAGGCFIELFIQLFIIMSGKQLLNSFLEITSPYLKRRITNKYFKKKVDVQNKEGIHKQVAEDLELNEWNSLQLAPEYLEMVIQYGFVTMFAVTFPFAPLLALINNLFEIRSDAIKLIVFHRKPVESRAKDIGVWSKIIHAISVISLISNALIIAFTTNFIPKIIFIIFKPEFASRFLDFTLSDFLVEDLEHIPEISMYNITTCKYVDQRNPYWHLKKYKLNFFFYLTTATKFGFVFVYQNVLYIFLSFLFFIISDIPKKINNWIKEEEKYITNYLIAKE